jgi:hypothetical protein
MYRPILPLQENTMLELAMTLTPLNPDGGHLRCQWNVICSLVKAVVKVQLDPVILEVFNVSHTP